MYTVHGIDAARRPAYTYECTGENDLDRVIRVAREILRDRDDLEYAVVIESRLDTSCVAALTVMLRARCVWFGTKAKDAVEVI